MSTATNGEDTKVATVTPADGATVTPGADDADQGNEQDPLKDELDKVKAKGSGKTELEKAIYTRQQLDKRIIELGGKPAEAAPVAKVEDDEDDKPVTMSMLKKMQETSVVTTALSLAEAIENESERELTKYHIANTIRTTGNPQEDLRLARAIVNSVKNARIAEIAAGKPAAKTHSNASSAPAKALTKEPEMSSEELAFMRPPFNMTKEQILKARQS